MNSIAIFHDSLGVYGGGEVVCMSVLEALQDDYDVTLFVRRCPPADDLNEHFDAAVDFDRLTVREPVDLHPLFPAFEHLGDALHERFGYSLVSLRRAAFVRLMQPLLDEYDLAVSTSSEYSFGTRAVIYYHNPVEADGALDALRRSLSRIVTDHDLSDVRSNVLLANSEFVGESIEANRDVTPRVVYPPVDTSIFDDAERPWRERENGFVYVGRIDPKNEVLAMIEIVRRLHERGHDVHFHVIGPEHDETYHDRVAAAADPLEYVHLEGPMNHDDIAEPIQSHRYALNARNPESFGIAVAEYVAGGAVPFVPARGGQTEVVDDIDDLQFSSVDEAVEKISSVLEDTAEGERLHRELPDVDSRFGHERFEREIRDVVASELEGQ